MSDSMYGSASASVQFNSSFKRENTDTRLMHRIWYADQCGRCTLWKYGRYCVQYERRCLKTDPLRTGRRVLSFLLWRNKIMVVWIDIVLFMCAAAFLVVGIVQLKRSKQAGQDVSAYNFLQSWFYCFFQSHFERLAGIPIFMVDFLEWFCKIFSPSFSFLLTAAPRAESCKELRSWCFFFYLLIVKISKLYSKLTL